MALFYRFMHGVNKEKLFNPEIHEENCQARYNDRRSTTDYRARCSCGWMGEVWSEDHMAAQDEWYSKHYINVATEVI